jgi:hypothetical protein
MTLHLSTPDDYLLVVAIIGTVVLAGALLWLGVSQAF